MKNLDIYNQVLDGSITINTAKKCFSSEKQSICEEIIVFSSQIFHVLQKYLLNEINAEELSAWASFLIFSDVYVCPDWEDDEKSAKYESMWYVLQQLSSPELDGEITKESVAKHMQVLHEIEADIGIATG